MRRAAIFDLDGTLIPNASAERTFFFYLLRTGVLTVADSARMIVPFLTSRGNLHEMIRGNKRYLRGKKIEKFQDVARNYYGPMVEKLVFREMRIVIERHREQGELLLMLSGTLDIIAESFASRLRFDGVKATDLEIRDGIYTGRVVGVVPYGFGKLEVLRDFRYRFGFDQNQTTLYANMYSDRYVMNAVDKPVAVNPDRRLREYAHKNGWEIIPVRKRG